jgi:hypothetical protein
MRETSGEGTSTSTKIKENFDRKEKTKKLVPSELVLK